MTGQNHSSPTQKHPQPLRRAREAVPLEPTRHGALKRVLLYREEALSTLCFVNEVEVAPGETIHSHAHETMQEVFYLLEGEGQMRLGEQSLTVKEGDCLLVPPLLPHEITNAGSLPLRFLCFGIEVDQP
ncbi:cupin domain-containing protein [Thermogemmatispora carboxidivorans]|uniref:cupin domain-containing protein n=1 Tax=Thermogemmatispora carboxidivorans TaxID=1382306 RepID=UPI00069A4641|nr:cupin domain-containing protein [Thermogemmatispora carboxidivorans]